MTKRPKSEVAAVGLRIREPLRARLEQAAKQNGVSLNREMNNRLADSFGYPSKLDFDQIRADMKVCWAKYSDRFMRLELQDDLRQAIADRNEAEAIAIVKALIASKEPPE